jgi:ketosteroid isomerase-like protein
MLLAAFTMSCQPSHQRQNQEKTTAMFDAFNRHEWRTMASFYAPSASFLDPSFGSDYVTKSREEIAAKYAAMGKIFPDIRDELTSVYASGDKMIVEFTSMGTTADGNTFKLPIISVLTFKDGLIVKDATYYDNP